jgi:hypothetical protein
VTRPARDSSGRGRAVSVYLTPREEQALREAAAARGVSVSALVSAWVRRLRSTSSAADTATTERAPT